MQFVPMITGKRKAANFLALGVPAAFALALARAQDVSVTAAFPPAIGVYDTLTTTGKTILARDGGSVGIGTALPAAALHVRKTSASLRFQTSGLGSFDLVVSNINGSRALSLRDVEAGTDRMTLHSSGRASFNFSDELLAPIVTGPGLNPIELRGGSEVKLEWRSARQQPGIDHWEVGLEGTDFVLKSVGAVYNSGIRITADGNLYLALNASAPPPPIIHKIQVDNGAHLDQTGHWKNTSSGARKKDVAPLKEAAATEAIRALSPVTYRYKDTENERHAGFIAEDVPELLASQDRKSVSPMDIVAALTAVIKKQERELQELEKELSSRSPRK